MYKKIHLNKTFCGFYKKTFPAKEKNILFIIKSCALTDPKENSKDIVSHKKEVKLFIIK